MRRAGLSTVRFVVSVAGTDVRGPVEPSAPAQLRAKRARLLAVRTGDYAADDVRVEAVVPDTVDECALDRVAPFVLSCPP